MARRLPSPPPNLPGFSFVRVLGSGGFADVFLYEQNLPRRQVAVKVMLAEVVTPQVRQMFQAEANLMAQLSAHPSILTVYQASVSSDGRPYLVMELCSATLGARFRIEPLSVPDVLRIGVKIASAVETAHRAGVLHRDIKPSNILTTAYGHPVLSDFGIAATLAELELSDSVGLSIPWSAPEVLLDDTPGTIASEVWSIGATLYSLLAGRSPFEVPGRETSSAELVSRITKAKPEPIDRPDLPERLRSVLWRSMSKRPAQRQASVMELIRELQAVETELGLAQTPAEVAVDDWAAQTESDPEDRTRVKGLVSVDPGAAPRRRRSPTRQGRTGGAVAASGGRSTTTPRLPERRTRTTTWLLVASAAVVLALGITATVLLVRVTTASSIPTVSGIRAEVSGRTVLFSWQDPGLEASDSYQVKVGDGVPSVQRARTFSVDAQRGKQVCITVTVDRSGKSGSPSSPTCAVPGGGS